MMKKTVTSLLLLAGLWATAQVKIGDNPTTINSSAVLETESTTKGFLPPRMTQAQMNAIANPAEGLIMYCTDCTPKGLYINTSSPSANWVSSSSGGSAMVLDCANQSRVGVAATGWSLTNGGTIGVPYSYNALGSGSVTISPISSTGVTGLTATCVGSPVTVSAGTGTLVFNITGTAASTGTASFPLTVLGSTCTMTYTAVTGATVSGLNCGGATLAKYLSSGFSSNGNTITLPYTGGNGGSYPTHSVASTGVTGVTASISAGTIVNGAGNLVYTLSGTPSGAGTATFNFSFGGQSCSFSTTVYTGAITSITNAGTPATDYNINIASNPSFKVNLDFDGTANGTQLQLWNGGTFTSRIWSFVDAGAGQYAIYNPASGRVADVNGGVANNSVKIVLYDSNVTAASGVNQRFALNAISGSVFGGGTLSIRPALDLTKSWDIELGNIANGAKIQTYSYDGNGAQIFRLEPVQTLVNGVAASNYRVVFGYLGGNSGTYPARTIASTGVTGLTATLSAGSFGDGNALRFLTFIVNGTPSGSGTASFPVFIGGQAFTFQLTVQ